MAYKQLAEILSIASNGCGSAYIHRMHVRTQAHAYFIGIYISTLISTLWWFYSLLGVLIRLISSGIVSNIRLYYILCGRSLFDYHLRCLTTTNNCLMIKEFLFYIYCYTCVQAYVTCTLRFAPKCPCLTLDRRRYKHGKFHLVLKSDKIEAYPCQTLQRTSILLHSPCNIGTSTEENTCASINIHNVFVRGVCL